MVEHFLDAGLQVFAMSWVNPSEDQRDLGLDDYAGSVLRAMDALEEITGAEQACCSRCAPAASSPARSSPTWSRPAGATGSPA